MTCKALVRTGTATGEAVLMARYGTWSVIVTARAGLMTWPTANVVVVVFIWPT